MPRLAKPAPLLADDLADCTGFGTVTKCGRNAASGAPCCSSAGCSCNPDIHRNATKCASPTNGATREQGGRQASGGCSCACNRRNCLHRVVLPVLYGSGCGQGHVTAALRGVFAQESATEILSRWEDLAASLAERFPKAAELMNAAREGVLAFRPFPKDH